MFETSVNEVPGALVLCTKLCFSRSEWLASTKKAYLPSTVAWQRLLPQWTLFIETALFEFRAQMENSLWMFGIFFPEVLQGKDRTCAFVNVLNNSLLVFFYSNWFFVPKQVSLSKKNSTCKPKPINITFQTQAYRFQFHAIREKALTTLREKTKISSADNKFLLYFSLQLKAG